MAVAACFFAGCQGVPENPITAMTLTGDQYETAFDAALDVSNERGFNASLRDRRRGIIETVAVISPTVFEPWRMDGATFDQVLENTSTMQRRRIIWEFSPQQIPGESEPGTLGPDVLALNEPFQDLTAAGTSTELRVAVVIERAASPGTRPSVWSTSDTTQTIIIDPETGQPIQSQYWTPVARDGVLESILLSAIRDRLNPPASGEAE